MAVTALTTAFGPYTEAANWIQANLWIKDKRGRARPLIRNQTQDRYLQAKAEAVESGRPARFLVLKSRRTGISTFEQALSYELTFRHRYKHAATLAHETFDSRKMFEVSRFFHRTLTGLDNEGSAREFRFWNGDSGFWVGTAGAPTFGRGQTFQRVHGSEVAFWPGKRDEQESLLAGLDEACSHGEIVLETTPNGAAGLFYDLWNEAKAGQNQWTPIFIPWWWDEENEQPLAPGETPQLEADLSDLERDLRAMHELTLEQLKWRRNKEKQRRRLFPQEYPEDDVSCFLQSGECYFDTRLLGEMARRCPPPIRTHRIPGGQLSIWEDADPECEYVTGTDCAEGIPAGDYSATVVLNATTGAQAARLHGHWRVHEHARHVYDLARRYTTDGQLPITAIERNNHGHAVIALLTRELRFPRYRLFHHMRFDQDGVKREKKIGWETNTRSRETMLQNLAEAIEDGGMTVRDETFIRECLTFVQTDTGKWEAAEGAHDDLIFAWGIAVQAMRTPKKRAVLVL